VKACFYFCSNWRLFRNEKARANNAGLVNTNASMQMPCPNLILDIFQSRRLFSLTAAPAPKAGQALSEGEGDMHVNRERKVRGYFVRIDR